MMKMMEKMMQGHNVEDMDFAEMQKAMVELSNGKAQQYGSFAAAVEHSRYRECVATNAFKFAARAWSVWSIGWSSVGAIFDNKRQFTVTVAAISCGKTIAGATVSGMPTAQQVIRILFQTMTYSAIPGTEDVLERVKPNQMILSWRMKDMFGAVQREMGAFGIHCQLEDEQETRRACIANGTRLDGFNHLD